jgi:Holliday junction DNA helicase RuvA
VVALLTGLVEAPEADRCVIDVSGVGYLVQASTRTLAALPRPPAVARLLVETVVREDAILLYGFADPAERDWFRLLTTVQGVGAKVALGILSALSPRELVTAIAAGDRAGLTRLPLGGAIAMHPAAVAHGPAADALSALANLGYRRIEAQPVVDRVLERLGAAAAIDQVIRDSLRELAK